MTLEELNGLSGADFVELLGGVYEHSKWVAEEVVALRPFESVEQVAAEMKGCVEASGEERRMALIQEHPDLAGKLAQAGELTEDSRKEQGGLGLDHLSASEYEEFSSLNAAYREKFGFPFIICARMQTRERVLVAFRERLLNEVDEEVQEALRQIHFIARLRLEDLFEGGLESCTRSAT